MKCSSHGNVGFSHLPNLKKVTLPHHVPLTANTELHVFGDAAANMGHRVAAYARTPVGDNGTFEMHLLFAKSRINHKRYIMVPRLELVASLRANGRHASQRAWGR